MEMKLCDCCPPLDRFAEKCDTACSLQILQSSPGPFAGTLRGSYSMLFTLRILVQHLEVGMSWSGVPIVEALLYVFAVISFAIGETEQLLL